MTDAQYQLVGYFALTGSLLLGFVVGYIVGRLTTRRLQRP